MLKKQFTRGLPEFSGKHFYPPIEEILPNMYYELTVSPADQSEDPYRIRNVINHLKEDILPMFHATIYSFIELSHKSQNIHIHGKIKWKTHEDIVKFYLTISRIKSLCTFAINPYRGIEAGWETYIRKQLPFIQSYLNNYYKVHNIEIPYTLNIKHQ